MGAPSFEHRPSTDCVQQHPGHTCGTSSRRSLLRMLPSKPLVKGKEDAGYEGEKTLEGETHLPTMAPVAETQLLSAPRIYKQCKT